MTDTALLCLIFGSVTTRQFLEPSLDISYPISSETPGPYLIDEVSIENAVSVLDCMWFRLQYSPF